MRQTIQKSTLVAAFLLGIFAVSGTGLVAVTQHITQPRIEANERLALLQKLQQLVPAESVDNDMVTDRITVQNPQLLGAAQTQVYRGRREGKPVAGVFTTIVPDGYSGPIKLLVAVRKDGTLGGVRVVSHKETPGLGDKIEEERSNWIHSFAGKSLTNPKPQHWAVKRDGGVFDQFTGATITPRSIVKAVKNTLIYATSQGDALYAQVTPATGTDTGEKKK
jgi:electron transport complex protein RnfG